MTKNHLEYFKVKNFRRFDELELDGLGQFNLITGDNNVGKTSLLEALLVDEDWKQTLWNYHRTLNIRGLAINIKSIVDPRNDTQEIVFPEANYLTFLINTWKALYIHFKVRKLDKLSGNWILDDKKQGFASHRRREVSILKVEPMQVNAKHFLRVFRGQDNQQIPDDYDTWLHVEELALGTTNSQPKGFPFLPVFRGHAEDVVGLFSEVARDSQQIEVEITNNMKSVVPEIQAIRILQLEGTDHLFLHIKGQDQPLPLTQFGDGAIRLFVILLHLIKNKGDRLMIDEVDTGIHHSRMKDFLKNLVKMAVVNDVQLFMTTHSLECQQAFAEVFEDPEMVHLQKEFRNIALVEAQDHSVKPFVYNFQQLSENLELGIETRGRKLA